MKSSILLAVMMVAAGVATAEDAAVPMAGYHLKNRSAFEPAESGRPPFWPIGWVHHTKAQQVQEIAQSKVILDPQMFSVTSILMGHPTLAVINGRAYSEGELLRAPRQKAAEGGPKTALPQTARVRVQKIADGAVTLVCEDQAISIPMRRPELNEHKDDKDEELLLSGGQ